MSVKTMIIKMTNGENTGINKLVLNLGEGIEARIKKQKDNELVIRIFSKKDEKKESKTKVSICLFSDEKETCYKFVFKISKKVAFMTTGTYGDVLRVNASQL